MPKLTATPPSWLRIVMITVLIGLGAILILFPAWLPEKPSLPVEDSMVEILQIILLGFSATLFFATAPHAGPYSAIYRSLGVICVAAGLAEIGDAIDNIINPLRYEYIVGALLFVVLVTLSRHRKELIRFLGFAARHPSSGFFIAAVIIVYAFSRVFGSDVFWSATLDGQHHPNTPSVCRAYLELLACYFMLLGSIGFCLPLSRRRYRIMTKP